MKINIPELPEPSVIKQAIADKKAEIGQLKELLRLAELQQLTRGSGQGKPKGATSVLQARGRKGASDV